MAALPPAGVNLQAQGFNDYIKKLNTVDKKQQEIFGTTSSKLDKSFAKAEKAAKRFENQLRKTAEAQKRAAGEAQKLAAAQKTAAAAQRQANISSLNIIIDVAKQIGTFVNESARLAAQFQGQQTGLQNLAASFGQSGSEIQAAIQQAAKGTVSGLDAIQAANAGLLLGVAETPAEFEKLTSIALTLGRTLGLTGTQAIEQFTTALGRQSLLILDNFGISAKQVNNEIERLAQVNFGTTRAGLSEAQRQAVFLEAALNVASEAAAKVGEEAGKAQAAFDGMDAAAKDLQVTFGEAVRPAATETANALAQAFRTAQQVIAIISGVAAGVSELTKQLGLTLNVFERIRQVGRGDFSGILGLNVGQLVTGIQNFDQVIENATRAGQERFKDVASTIAGVTFETDGATKAFEEQADAIMLSENALKAYQTAIQQAENLQLSFARAAEDTALKLARANEDIARKQGRQIAKLEERQAKDRDKLLKDQQKQLDRFEDNRRKQIAKAENDIAKARKEAGEQRKRDQQKLQRELRQAQERFNLSRLQSERRFNLSEKRLRAEGDILALQELREDFALQQQEEKENFDLSKKETVQGAKEQQKEQAKDLENRLSELKTNLEDQRAELLQSFDEQLAQQQIAQQEAQAQQQLGFEEAAQDRQIALAREEEDRRISQARQLEDLGISLARQEGITEEGVAAIAGEMEKVFGQEGVADNIITGFTERTESDFKILFDELEKIISGADLTPEITAPRLPLPLPGAPRLGGEQEFQEGGVVGGPIGSSQVVRAHGGETILPTHQNTQRGQFFRNVLQQAERGTFESFRMSAPVIPSQEVSVRMSGGFNITGDGQANEAILQAATQEMTENFKIAVRRLRRNN